MCETVQSHGVGVGLCVKRTIRGSKISLEHHVFVHFIIHKKLVRKSRYIV